MQQDVAAADAGEDVHALADRLGQAGNEGREFEVGTIDPVGHLHQARQVHRAMNAVKVFALESELGEQEFGHGFRTVVGDLEAHGVAEVTEGQFALQLGAQVGDFFLVNKEVGIARRAELVAAEHRHAGEQFADELVQDRRHEDEAVFAAGNFRGHPGDAWQDARRLDNGGVGTAPEGVLAFEFDGKIEALVEDLREGMRGVESDRRQYRHHLAEEKVADPVALGIIPFRAAQEADSLFRHQRQDDIVQVAVLLGDEGVRFRGYEAKCFQRCLAVGGDDGRIGLELFLEAGHAHLEEFVHIAGDDAQEAQAFEQRHPLILRLGQHATVEGEKAEFPVQIVFRRKVRFDILTGHDRSPLFLEVYASRPSFCCVRLPEYEADAPKATLPGCFRRSRWPPVTARRGGRRAACRSWPRFRRVRAQDRSRRRYRRRRAVRFACLRSVLNAGRR